jgi:hypothetical protein
MVTRFVVFGTSTDIAVGFGDRSSADVLVCRATHSFWFED